MNFDDAKAQFLRRCPARDHLLPTPKQIGFGEIGLGVLTVLAVVCGTRFGW